MYYRVSYDLVGATAKVRRELREKIEEMGGKRILSTDWILYRKKTNVGAIFTELEDFINDKDRLVVSTMARGINSHYFVSTELVTDFETLEELEYGL